METEHTDTKTITSNDPDTPAVEIRISGTGDWSGCGPEDVGVDVGGPGGCFIGTADSLFDQH